jgi:hypothetical protein
MRVGGFFAAPLESQMPDFILLMHAPAGDEVMADWTPYLDGLAAKGALRGGSVIGSGVAMRRDGAEAAVSASLSGFVRIVADDLDQARAFVAGNPTYEAGGTVEVRELPVTG